MDNLKLYFAYIGMFFRSRAEYKTSFFAGMFANFYCYFVTYTIFWLMTQRFTTIGGWNFSELTVLYGTGLLAYAISGVLFWGSIYFLESAVTEGKLDILLLRPKGMIIQLICSSFGYTFIGQIIVTVIFLGLAFANDASLHSWTKILYYIVALAGGVLINGGAVIIVGALSFWVKRSTQIGGVFYYTLREFCIYPLNIYPRYIKLAVTYVFPWAFINYYPAAVLLGKSENGYDYCLGLLAPLVGVAFFLLSLKIFSLGLRKYESAGN